MAARGALDFQETEPGIDDIADHWGRLRRSFESNHALGPSIASQRVGFLSSFLRPLGCHANAGAVQGLARLGAHAGGYGHGGGSDKPLRLVSLMSTAAIMFFFREGLKMSRAAGRFTQADIARATRAAKQAGAAAVLLLPDGTIKIEIHSTAAGQADDLNPWDEPEKLIVQRDRLNSE